MNKLIRSSWVVVGTLAGTLALSSGGGPENILVLYNGAEAARHDGPMNDSYEIAEHYRVTRCIPLEHMVPITGLPEPFINPATGNPLEHTITVAEYESSILSALTSKLNSLSYAEEIDYLVVVRGLPYRVDLEPAVSAPNDCASLTAMLGVYRTDRASDPTAFLYKTAHPISSDPPFRKPSTRNPYWYGENYVAGDYAPFPDPDLNGAEGLFTTSTEIVRRTSTEMQEPSFRRMTAVPVDAAPDDWQFTGNLFIVTRLDGFDYSDAYDLVQRGAAADGTYPAQNPPLPGAPCSGSACTPSYSAPKILGMRARNLQRDIRDPECKFATSKLTTSYCSEYVMPHDANLDTRSLAAYFTGSDKLVTHIPADGDALTGNCFVLGAISCNLTSNAGNPPNWFCDDTPDCPPIIGGVSKEVQSSVARIIRHGVTGAHCTVAEPFVHAFPGAGTLLLYTLGYNFSESFFFTQPFVHWQNTYVGDPITSPHATRPVVTMSNTVIPVNGTLHITASHVDGIERIRFYLDGNRMADVVNTSCSSPFTIPVSLQGIPTGQKKVLAVAYACDGTVSRPDWPEPVQVPRHDVQGWACGILKIKAVQQM